MSAELLITRGLPGSGKTTWAKAWVTEDPDHRARINRDDTRSALHGGHRGRATEDQVTIATHAAITALLASGTSVISDDTNLVPDHAFQLQLLAARAGVRARLVDLTSVPLDLCLSRNASRTNASRVPEEYIRAMHRQYIAIQDHADTANR
jgi:predicted kinase